MSARVATMDDPKDSQQGAILLKSKCCSPGVLLLVVLPTELRAERFRFVYHTQTTGEDDDRL